MTGEALLARRSSCTRARLRYGQVRLSRIMVLLFVQASHVACFSENRATHCLSSMVSIRLFSFTILMQVENVQFITIEDDGDVTRPRE